MSLMVLVVTGTPPKTANGAVAAIGVTAGRVVGSIAAKRRSASCKTAVDAVVCAAMAVDICAIVARRLAMSVLVTAVPPVGESGGVRGGVSTMLISSGHDKSRSRQMRLLRSWLGPDDEEDLVDTTCRLGTVLRILSLVVA